MVNPELRMLNCYHHPRQTAQSQVTCVNTAACHNTGCPVPPGYFQPLAATRRHAPKGSRSLSFDCLGEEPGHGSVCRQNFLPCPLPAALRKPLWLDRWKYTLASLPAAREEGTARSPASGALCRLCGAPGAAVAGSIQPAASSSRRWPPPLSFSEVPVETVRRKGRHYAHLRGWKRDQRNR